MKGVIVQVGEPKSIVLFNSGKIGAIPNPAGCHVGMVVSFSYNNRLKIAALAFAAVLLVASGIFIGTRLTGRKTPAASFVSGAAGNGNYAGGNYGNENRDREAQNVTAEAVKKFPDDAKVILTGNIVASLGNKMYTFRDSTGEITVEIDRKLLRDLPVNAADTVEISGEVDVEHGRLVIDVKNVRKR